MKLDEIAALNDNELARALRHLRGINSTNPEPAVLVSMAESEASFFQGYARALLQHGIISAEQFRELVGEVLDELERVYVLHAPDKAASSDEAED